MRVILSVAAIVLAALGLVWILRLATRSAQIDSGHRATYQRPSCADCPLADSERLAEKPEPTLGPIGGTLPETLVDPRLLAEKSRRTLTVFSDGQAVKTYRIALGSDPMRPKEREGDGRTPEGTSTCA